MNSSISLPRTSEGLARRFIVFLLVVPVSFAAAQWLAFSIASLMKGDAPLDANSVSTMMFVQPTIWAILMSWQLLLDGPRNMFAPPAAIVAMGTLIWMMS